MMSLVQFLDRSGIYEDQRFMIVPDRGFNLVCLRDSRDVGLEYNRDVLKVEYVNREQVEAIALEYIDTRLKDLKTQDRNDKLKQLRTGLYGVTFPDSAARGLKITAKGKGYKSLTATRGGMSLKFEIAIMPRVEYKIAFRFLRRLDKDGRMTEATRFSPADAPWFMSMLNWTFGAQANVFFTFVDADWVNINKPLPRKIPRDLFKTEIAPKKSGGAELTCFLVGDYDATTTEAAGEYLPDEKVCLVVDDGNPGVFDPGEAFTGVMAHEVGHFVHHRRGNPGNGHHDRRGLLLSTGTESLYFDKQLVTDFNMW